MINIYEFIGKPGKFYKFRIKLNYNCPKDEKQGEGPGSCSGGKIASQNNFQSDDLEEYGFDEESVTMDAEQAASDEGIEDEQEYMDFISDYVDRERKAFESKLTEIRKNVKIDKKTVVTKISVPKEFKGTEKSATNIGIKLLGSKLVSDIPDGIYIDDYTKNSRYITEYLINHPTEQIKFQNVDKYIDDVLKSHPDWTKEDAFNDLYGVFGRNYKSSNKQQMDEILIKNTIATLDKYIDQSVLSGSMKAYSGISREYADALPSTGGFVSNAFMSVSTKRDVAEEFAENRQDTTLSISKSTKKLEKSSKQPSKQIYVLEVDLQKGDKALSTYGFYKQNMPDVKYDLGRGEKLVSDVREFILPRNGEFEITGRRTEGNINIISIKTRK